MRYLVNNLLIASDHGGFTLKNHLMKRLQNNECTALDLGCYSQTAVDYPDFANLLCRQMLSSESCFGVLLCSSGIGMTIAANRFQHIRAALCFSKKIAQLSRKHNDANVLVLPAKFISAKTAFMILESFLCTEFEEGRHQPRVAKLNAKPQY